MIARSMVAEVDIFEVAHSEDGGTGGQIGGSGGGGMGGVVSCVFDMEGRNYIPGILRMRS